MDFQIGSVPKTYDLLSLQRGLYKSEGFSQPIQESRIGIVRFCSTKLSLASFSNFAKPMRRAFLPHTMRSRDFLLPSEVTRKLQLLATTPQTNDENVEFCVSPEGAGGKLVFPSATELGRVCRLKTWRECMKFQHLILYFIISYFFLESKWTSSYLYICHGHHNK